MRAFESLPVLRLVMALLLALAFAGAGFARAAPSIAEARLDALMLAGFDKADLCRDAAEGHAHLAECSLCNLVSNSTFPDGTLSLLDMERRLVASILLPQIRRAALHRHDPAIPPRGPPPSPI